MQPTEPVNPAAPVAGAADSFESNQSRETATVLSGATGSLAATATDTDFYRLDAAAGEVTFTLTADVAEGDLNLELYDAAGVLLTGRYNVEPVSEVSFTLDADGPIFAFIYARGGFQGNVYGLAWAADGTGDSGGPAGPVDPVAPTDPLTPADTPQPSDSFPVREAVIRQGVADWVQAALTGRADVLVLGDSVVFKDGVGWDGGLSAGFDRTLGLAGTGLLSGNYSNSNGAGYGYESFGQNPSNWGFAFVPGTDVAAITNDEINSDEYARSQHPWGEVTVNARRGTVAELGVQVSRQGDTAEPDRAFTFEAYVSGDGALYNVTRTAADGSTIAVGLQQVTSADDQLVSFDFAAGTTAGDAFQSIAITDPSQLSFIPFGSDRTLEETPLTISNFRLLETGSTGVTVTSWGYGGQSTREFVEEQYNPLGKDNTAELLDRVVEGGSGKLLVFVMEGLNDKNETQPSLNGIADGDSTAAFIDNVDTLIRQVRLDWAGAGNDPDDLEFITFGTYDQGSDPKLEDYSAALQQHALDTEDVSFIDLRTLSGGLSLNDMVDLGYINGPSNGDFVHLNESGAVFYGEAIAKLLAETATP